MEEYREEIDCSAVRIRENREFSAKIQSRRDDQQIEFGSLVRTGSTNAPTSSKRHQVSVFRVIFGHFWRCFTFEWFIQTRFSVLIKRGEEEATE